MSPRPSILLLEQAFLSAWPSFETEQDGGWLYRAAQGYSKRANSFQTMDPGDADKLDYRIDQICAWFEARELSPCFRETPLAHPAISKRLVNRGWVGFDRSIVMVAPAISVHGCKFRSEVFSVSDPVWREVQADLGNYDLARQGILSGILDLIRPPAQGVVVYDDDGEKIGSALVVVVNGIAVYLNVMVAAKARGRGVGKAVMRMAMGWAQRHGASWHALQMVADNAAAKALYGGLGFSQLYEYKYFKPAP